jgi:hypothetical protein
VTDDLVARYLRALGDSDLPGMLDLFADGAVVHSPLYGELPASEFYPKLFADTGAATLTLRGSMRGESVSGIPLVSFLFRFDWTLPNGTRAPFDVVDVAELDPTGRITSLRIVYDTVDVRPAFEADTGRNSVR